MNESGCVVTVFSPKELLEIADRQKYIIGLVLLSLVGSFIKYAFIPIGIFMVYFIYKLAIAVRSSYPFAYVICAFIPFLSLIALLHINGKATRILRDNGIKVGLMGARESDLEKLEEAEKEKDEDS